VNGGFEVIWTNICILRQYSVVYRTQSLASVLKKKLDLFYYHAEGESAVMGKYSMRHGSAANNPTDKHLMSYLHD
jgi:hypothetical protein